MSEKITSGKFHGRSPGHPVVSLQRAIHRLNQFYEHFKKTPARLESVGSAWKMRGQARMRRNIAALTYFGLLDHRRAKGGSTWCISELGMKYLMTQQEHVKREIIKEAALHARAIRQCWELWGARRPADAACIDTLMFEHGYSPSGAKHFLQVYDATIEFASLTADDEGEGISFENEKLNENDVPAEDIVPAPTAPDSLNPDPERVRQNLASVDKQLASSSQERVLAEGLLSEKSKFRILVNGPVGPREIDNLIRKLQLDREILAGDATDSAMETHVDNDDEETDGNIEAGP